MHRPPLLLALSLLLPGAAAAQTTPEPVPALAASLRLPAGSYVSATQHGQLGQALPAGSLTVNGRALRPSLVTDLMIRLPAQFGLTCGSQELTLQPAQAQDYLKAKATLLGTAGTVGLLETYPQLTVRRGDTLATLRWQGDSLLLASCNTTSSGTPKVVTPPVNVYAGAAPWAVAATTTGKVAWCGPGGTVRERQVFSGGLNVLALDWDAQVLAVAGWDPGPVLRLLDARTGETVRTVPLPVGVIDVAFSGTGDRVIVHDPYGRFALFDPQRDGFVKQFEQSGWQGGPLLGGGERLFVLPGGSSGPTRVFDAERGVVTRSLSSIEATAAVLTRDGQWAAQLLDGGQLRAYAAQSSSLGFARTPDHLTTLPVRGPAVLLPGRGPGEVQGAVNAAGAEQVAGWYPFRWQVGQGAATVGEVLPASPDALLTFSREAGTASLVPACLK